MSAKQKTPTIQMVNDYHPILPGTQEKKQQPLTVAKNPCRLETVGDFSLGKTLGTGAFGRVRRDVWGCGRCSPLVSWEKLSTEPQ